MSASMCAVRLRAGPGQPSPRYHEAPVGGAQTRPRRYGTTGRTTSGIGRAWHVGRAGTVRPTGRPNRRRARPQAPSEPPEWLPAMVNWPQRDSCAGLSPAYQEATVPPASSQEKCTPTLMLAWRQYASAFRSRIMHLRSRRSPSRQRLQSCRRRRIAAGLWGANAAVILANMRQVVM